MQSLSNEKGKKSIEMIYTDIKRNFKFLFLLAVYGHDNVAANFDTKISPKCELTD